MSLGKTIKTYQTPVFSVMNKISKTVAVPFLGLSAIAGIVLEVPSLLRWPRDPVQVVVGLSACTCHFLSRPQLICNS